MKEIPQLRFHLPRCVKSMTKTMTFGKVLKISIRNKIACCLKIRQMDMLTMKTKLYPEPIRSQAQWRCDPTLGDVPVCLRNHKAKANRSNVWFKMKLQSIRNLYDFRPLVSTKQGMETAFLRLFPLFPSDIVIRCHWIPVQRGIIFRFLLPFGWVLHGIK